MRRDGFRPRFGSRRGVAVAALVIVLALVNVLVLASVSAGREDGEVVVWRVEGLRAFYAAESAARVALRSLQDGVPGPEVGSELPMPSATARYLTMPDASGAGSIVVVGRSGEARRRIRVTVEPR